MKPINIGGRNISHVYFIGIGGSSMSGLAIMLKNAGYKVSGSDRDASDKTAKLERMAIRVKIGHAAENIESNVGLVVFTAAIAPDNPELLRAREMGIPTVERAKLLGIIMEMYDYGIAVSGTHGKTTTTSMISLIMLEAGKDPGIHIGSELTALGGNSTYNGSSTYFITEACEYTNSYHQLRPFVSLILNVDADHLDFFKDISDIRDSFTKFASLTHPGGFIVYNGSDENTVTALKNVDRRKISFGISDGINIASGGDTAFDYSARGVKYDEAGFASYDIIHGDERVCAVKLQVPGRHFVLNSLAAAAAGLELGCSPASIAAGLLKFKGAKKRSELIDVKGGVVVMDDYAHHPTEVKTTLAAMKMSTKGRLWCVFQPHTYTRTRLLMNEFTGAFTDADEIIVSPIYAAREPDPGNVHASDLAKRLSEQGKHVIYMEDFKSIAKHLAENVKPGDKIVTMGAGDISNVGKYLLELL